MRERENTFQGEVGVLRLVWPMNLLDQLTNPFLKSVLSGFEVDGVKQGRG